MRIDKEKIKPFFQTVIHKNNLFSLKKFNKRLKERIATYNEKKYKNIKMISEGRNPCSFYTYSLKEFPNWYKANTEITNSLRVENFEDREIVLVLLYEAKGYIFTHSTNSVLSEIINDVLSIDLNQKKLNLSEMYSILDDDELQLRTLGINNTFGAGGIAAEAKTYFGRDTQYSLNVAYDSGYSFSYCLASKNNGTTRSSFGCSTKKRKVWGTWTESIDDFITKCNAIEKTLSKNLSSEIFDILVNPIKDFDPSSNELIHFHLDYSIPNKGLTFLRRGNEFYSNWQTSIGKDEVIIIRIDGLEVSLKHTWDGERINFQYCDPDNTLKVVISGADEEIKGKRNYDLIEYLEKDNFTLIFESGIAYRDRTFWRDNRLNNIFNDSCCDIKWDDVDIKRESKEARDKNKKNISTALENYIKLRFHNEKYILINDNGANEIADHICVFEDHIILIHEKYSSQDKPGLRAGDVQEVIAQALKNMRYFIPLDYEESIDRLKVNSVHMDQNITTELIDFLYTAIRNKDVQNECWIVQPGIRQSKLEHDQDNKIHYF